jgi:hypothetical protein
MRSFILVLALFVPFLSCASMRATPPPMAADPTNVGIALSLIQNVRTSVLSGGFFVPETVFFIRFENSDDKTYKNPVLVASNYKYHGLLADNAVVFTLNLPPGEYAPVAAVGYVLESTSDGSGESKREVAVFFPKETIESARVIVSPGTIVYIGEIYMKSASPMNGADEVQMYYYRLFTGNEKRTDTYVEMFFRWFLRGNSVNVAPEHQGIAKSKQLQTEFLLKYRKHFKESNWAGHFDKRLAELEK